MRPELDHFREIEMWDFRDLDPRGRMTSGFPWLLYDTVGQQGICWCASHEVAKSLLLRSGYFRLPCGLWHRGARP